MINTKKDYESPTTKILEVHVQGIVCQSGGKWDSSIKPGSVWGSDEIDFGLE